MRGQYLGLGYKIRRGHLGLGHKVWGSNMGMRGGCLRMVEVREGYLGLMGVRGGYRD